MADLENYRGLEVLDSASQPGGEAISDNFRRTVEWHPRSVWDKTSDPTANDDGTDDSAKNYQVGSLWYNTSSKKLFICTNNMITHAKWQLIPFLLLQVSDGVNDPKLSASIDANGFQIFNGSFAGNGASLTAVVADSVITQTPNAVGNSVVARNASASFSANEITANTFVGSGASITNLNAANISTGTLATSRGGTGLTTFSGANRLLVSSSASALSLLGATGNRVLVTDGSSNISWGATLPAVSGANLTSLSAANITGSNALPDGVLSTNVPLKNSANTFSAAQTLPSNGLVVGTNQLVVSGGNVGIGTASPSDTLSVNGNITLVEPGGNTSRDIKSSGNSGGIRVYACSSLTASPSGAAIQFFGTGNTLFPGQFYIDSGANDSAALIFRTCGSGGTITERMRINASGLIGIGGVDASTHVVEVNGGAYCDGSDWVSVSSMTEKRPR